MSGADLQHLAPQLRARNNLQQLSSFHSPSSPLPSQFASDFDTSSYQAYGVNGLSPADAMSAHAQFSSRPNNNSNSGSNNNNNAFVQSPSHVQFQTPPPQPPHMHYPSQQQQARQSGSLDGHGDGANPTSLAGHTLRPKAQYYNADLSRQFPGIASEHHDAYMALHEQDTDMHGSPAGAGAGNGTALSSSSPSSPNNDDSAMTSPTTASHHLADMKRIAQPPNLEHWRELLFHVTEPLTLSEAEFHTYFPHVDNVYSHRSTQKYKRKPFVSHYWDCRLKGRPPGTPKSDDPNKRKRQRTTRDRDLCDVKIKITEYFATNSTAAAGLDGEAGDELNGGGGGGNSGHSEGLLQHYHPHHHYQQQQQQRPPPLTFIMEHADKDSRSPGGAATGAGGHQHSGSSAAYMQQDAATSWGQTAAATTNNRAAFGVLAPSSFPPGHPGAHGGKYYTIQRVNGNSAAAAAAGAAAMGGSTKDEGDNENDDGGDGGVAGLHKHTLADSDKIKKNSVQRWMLKQEKERKKSSLQTASTPSGSSTTTNNAGAATNSTITNNNNIPTHHPHSPSLSTTTTIMSPSPYTPLSVALASGPARLTALSHSSTPQPHHHHHHGGSSSSASSSSASSNTNASNANTLTLFGNAFCPFTQRVWIALEVKAIPYAFVEIVPQHMLGGGGGGGVVDGSGGLVAEQLPREVLDLNPDGVVPCIRHGNWAAWESGVLMEYLEDLEPAADADGGGSAGGRRRSGGAAGTSLLPVGNPRLRAHCRLWTDHINRKILPAFYALLLTPPAPPSSSLSSSSNSSTSSPPISDIERRARLAQSHVLAERLQTGITALVNASHATGPFFLGGEMSFVDVAFAPWIIRLSRVLEHYRAFPKPEVGSRWMAMVDAVERDPRVRATVSDERAYHNVYRSVAERGVLRREGLRPGYHGCGYGYGAEAAAAATGDDLRQLQHLQQQQQQHVVGGKLFAEMEYAKKVVREEGFGLGGDVWGLVDADIAARMS